MSAAKTNAERQREFRQRKAASDETEVRGIFANLSVRENLVMAARAGPEGARDWTFERVMATFPRLAERLGNS